METYANAKVNPYAEKVAAPMREGSLEARLAILRSAIDEAFEEFERLADSLGAVSNPMPTAIGQAGAGTSQSIPGSNFGVALQAQINRVGELCDKLRHQRNALDLT